MLRLSKKADYALMAMKHLATRTDLASASAREIAEQYDIPVELMAKVLQRLARRGLLTSHQGTRGGYRLAHGAERDFGRRHHPGDRRPADGDRLLDRSGELRPVREVQRPRSAVAHQGSHPRGAGDLLAAGSRRPNRRPRSRRPPLAFTRSVAPDHDARPVYLDYHATTPVDPRVLEAMLPYFTEQFGNPASRQHAYGWDAQKAVDAARAAGRGAHRRQSAQRDRLHQRRDRVEQPGDQGRRRTRCRDRGDHIITVATEHKSVLDSCKRLEREGCRVTRLGVDARGLHRSRRAARRDHRRTVLVSVMAANNEIGVLQPLGRDRRHRAASAASLLHTDAAQAAGKIPIDVDALRHRSAVADRRTSITARRAPARSTCGAASRSSSCRARSTAAATRTACAPAR